MSPEERYRPLKEPLFGVVRDHPGHGYRRLESELKARGHRVGEWKVRRGLRT